MLFVKLVHSCICEQYGGGVETMMCCHAGPFCEPNCLRAGFISFSMFVPCLQCLGFERLVGLGIWLCLVLLHVGVHDLLLGVFSVFCVFYVRKGVMRLMRFW